MSDDVFDVAVIGGGPGGYTAAIRARQLGMTTVLIEKDKLGGRCLNYACIPAKAVLRSAEVLQEVRGAALFGAALPDGEVGVDFAAVAKRRDRVVRTLTGGVAGLMKKHAVLVVEGEASLAAPNDTESIELHVEGAEGPKRVRAAHVVVATGSAAAAVPIPGCDFGGRIVDTAGAWLTTELPRSLAVIGGGVSGVEIASAFGRLGSDVTLLEALENILPGEEPAISEALTKELGKQNVEVVTGARISAVEQDESGASLTFGDATRSFDMVCVAAGRTPDIQGLDLAAHGVTPGPRGPIEVGPGQRTGNPRIFAIGDVAPGPALAHKASEEAVVAIETIGGWSGVHQIVLEDIPRVTFSSPQVASIGMTEAEAKSAGLALKVGEFPLAAAGAATVHGDRGGFVKIIGDAASGRIVGAHILGAKAGEMISELAVAKSSGVGFGQLARVIHAHPTFGEAVLEAARAADDWVIHA